jgi:hypothetical protein
MKMNKLGSFIEPEISVTLEAYRKMRNYVMIHDKEIGWFGTVVNDGNKYVIADVFLPEQEVNGTYNEIGDKTLIKLASELNSEQISRIKCYGHSHVNMSVSPSGTDNEQVEELTSGSSWFITVINNKRDNWYVAFNDYARGLQFEFDELPLYIPKDETIANEIKEKVKNRVVVATPSKAVSRGYQDYWGNYGGYGVANSKYQKKDEKDTGKDTIETDDNIIYSYKVIDNLVEYYLQNMDNQDIGETTYRAIVETATKMSDCDSCPYAVEGKCTVLEFAGATSKYGIEDTLCPDLLEDIALEDMYDYEDYNTYIYYLEEFMMDRYSVGGARK